MALSTEGSNVAADAVAAVAGYASLHDGDPGTTGANELAGGSPAYARQAITWDPASGGTASISAEELFDVPPSTTVSHVGVWSAASGGTYYHGGPLSASEPYTDQGQYELADTTLTFT